MATLDELQQQFAALQAKVNAITEPPDDYYTSRYSGEELDNIADRAKPGGYYDKWVSQLPGQNLLDNSVFIDGCLVDQRGGYVVPPGSTWYTEAELTNVGGTITGYGTIVEKTSTYAKSAGGGYFAASDCVRGYTGAGNCVDRWLFSGTVTLEADGILIKQSSTEFFIQKLPNEILNAIRGKVITISFAYIDGGLKIATSTFTVAPYGDIDSPEIAVGNVFFDLYKYGEDVARIRFFAGNTGNSIKLAAVKLELGSKQTLAHKEGDAWVLNEIPNYAEQLARCQRYQLTLGNNSSWGYAESAAQAYVFVPLPVTMRTTPVFSGSIQLYPVDGNTVTSTSVISASSNMVCIALAGTGFTPGKVYSAYIVSGILDANL